MKHELGEVLETGEEGLLYSSLGSGPGDSVDVRPLFRSVDHNHGCNYTKNLLELNELAREVGLETT